jgi:Tol biopolymer transport system component
VISIALLIIGSSERVARAACNTIPGPSNAFRSQAGTVDRPFAGPGDFVTIGLDPVCDGSRAFAADPSGNVVTVVFTPPGGGARNVVVLATSCDGIGTCAGAGSTKCLVGDPLSIQVIDGSHLRFRFPDTHALVGLPDADLTLTGPATIAVTTGAAACGLVKAPCAAQTDVVACIDDLQDVDGACGARPDDTFAHFVALPPANDFQTICTDPVPPCAGTEDDVRFTVDATGNLLVPMDWRGVLVQRDAVPVARLLRATTSVEAFEGRGIPIHVPDSSILGSYSREGTRLPPIFDPQSDASNPAVTAFFGTADAPQTVLRIARHAATYQECAGGPNGGLPCFADGDCPGGSCAAPRCHGGAGTGQTCATDADCPGGECGPGLFDFSTRLVGRIGPVDLRLNACLGGSRALATCMNDADCPGGQCGSLEAQARDPVPLDGLVQTPTLNVLVMEEAIQNADLNGDGDQTDHVVKLMTRTTGELLPTMPDPQAGRALTRVAVPPFSFPALAVEGDVVAFLEPESAQSFQDRNGDGDVFDTMLRVFRTEGQAATDVTGTNQWAVDAAPLVNARSLAVSNGRVFFRAAENDRAKRRLVRPNVATNGTPGNAGFDYLAISPDGRYATFASGATNLVPPGESDTNTCLLLGAIPPAIPCPDIFVHDFKTGTTERVSVGSGSTGAQADQQSTFSAISADGNVIAFTSMATNLAGPVTFPYTNVFVRDRRAGTTELISIGQGGVAGDYLSGHWGISLSADGNRVAYGSLARNLVPGGTTHFGVFVRDRSTQVTQLVNVKLDGTEGDSDAVLGSISANGRFVVFSTDAAGLVPDDTNGTSDVFVRDLDAGRTERVSVDSAGQQSAGVSVAAGFIRNQLISEDGRFVAFASTGALVPGKTSGAWDVFVRDRLLGTTERVDLSTGGEQPNSGAYGQSISADGRLVFFLSASTNLAPNEAPMPATPPLLSNLFVHDRKTGITDRALQVPDWSLQNRFSSSLDGRTLAFIGPVSQLFAGDGFVQEPDPTDVASDLNGDGDRTDTVLQVLDPNTGALLGPSCPADEVAVADGVAAFLRPEEPTGTPACPGGSLNPPDTDTNDRVVQLWSNGTVQNLGRAATSVAISNAWVAALVSESGNGADYNGDNDRLDTVVQVHPVGPGGWGNTGQAADQVAVSGDIVAFTTPEAAQGSPPADLNGDGDALDRMLQCYNAHSNTLTPVGQAEEFVLGETGLVAFRTRECAQGGANFNGCATGGTDLNTDGDAGDGVLRVYDAVDAALSNSGLAVTPCRLEACDPLVPYRVLNDTVRFLTFECDQHGNNFNGCPGGGTDLDGDGDAADLVLMVLNVRQAAHDGTTANAIHALASTPVGVCTTSGTACATNADCTPGACFLPPGGCVRDLGTSCDPALAQACPLGQFCQPVLGMPGMGTCAVVAGPCRGHDDGQPQCEDGAVCSAGEQAINRLVSPLRKEQGGGAVFTGSGRCVENFHTPCATSSDCLRREYCDGGTCRRDHGTCRKDANCPLGSTCVNDLLIQTAADQDGDEIPDVIDNCPTVPNVLQQIGDCATSCSPVLDPKANVVVRGSTGAFSTKLELNLSSYTGEAIAVKLTDGDPAIIAHSEPTVPAPKGAHPRVWSSTIRGNGLDRIVLRNLAPSQPGRFRLQLKAKRWFTAADANQPAASTVLTVTIGNRCFTHVVTRKRD